MTFDIFDKQTWNEAGIICRDAETTKRLHKFLREAVLDRHIYLNKAVCFRFMSTEADKRSDITNIARDRAIGDSYFQMILNIKDLIVLNTEVKSVKFNLHKGENFTTDSQFYESRTPYDVIYTNPYLCRCLRGEVILELKLQYDCGYAPIEKNSGLVTGRSNYFPCFTDYSLQEYVRILPMDPAGDARTIPIRYYNGFTKEQFQTLLKSWLAIAKRDKREEEQKWLEKYPDMA